MRKLSAGFIFVIVIGLCSVFNVNAQPGIRAGINFSNIIGHNVGTQKLNLKINTGFHVGGLYDIRISESFFVQPGILFSTKGSKENGVPGPDNYTFTKTGYYLEVPINIIYRPSLRNGHLLFGTGPYFGYGLGGKWTNESTANTKGNLVFVNDFDQYNNAGGNTFVYGRNPDYGINLLIGYEFANKISIQLNGQLGLRDITPLKDDQQLDVKQNNVQFGMSVGYKF